MDEDLSIVHGDFNSKNIVILNNDKLGLIDFEHYIQLKDYNDILEVEDVGSTVR